MKKIALLSGILFYIFFQHIKAQSQGVNFGDLSSPVPSVSALVNYTNSPPSNATGIPDISFPLAALSTYNPNIKLNTAISYDPNSAAQGSPATQVGSGWSLFTPGVISRHINLLPDELLPDSNSGNSNEVYFDDVYYYNIPGVFGKFRFKRNVQNNTFELINLSANKLKIEYTRADNSTKLTVKDFTITDNKGIRYLFKDYSQNNYTDGIVAQGPGKVYRSAFFVSQIIDVNGVELASFSYQKDTKYKNYLPGVDVIDYQTCKIKTITANGFGKLDLEYAYDPFFENSMNDPYQLQNVVLKDLYNHIISKYEFEYTLFNYTKRELTKLKKINRSNGLQEAIEFAYKTITPPRPAHPHQKPSSLCPNTFEAISWSQDRVLNRVINPYGGVVEYNFEFAQVYYDKAAPSYINLIKNGGLVSNETHYVSTLLDIPYDTNQSREYTFVVPGNYPMTFTGLGIDELYPLDPLGSFFDEPYLDYTVDGIAGTVCGLDYNGFRSHPLPLGTHTLKISGTGGKGSVGILVLEYVPFPYPNKDYSPYMVRISDIKYYIDKTGTTPAKTIKYDYDDFSDANSSSGYWASADQDVNSSYILYKNVKVSDSDDSNGYTKYYYKMSDDFPKISNYHPYYALTCGGLLDKKEVYNKQNKLLVSEKTEYTFEEISGAQEYYIKGAHDLLFSKPAWLKKTINTVSSNFDNNQSVQESSETEFNAFNFEIASTKKIRSGEVAEQTFTYPFGQSGYNHLELNNIIKIPIEIKSSKNGKLISNTQIKYSNGSFRPTSVVSINPHDNSVKTNVRYDSYDEYGNTQQNTTNIDEATGQGFSTVLIWGYNKTTPIAKIEGAKLTDIGSLANDIITKSNQDVDAVTEKSLLAALDSFKNLSNFKNFQITTYTYDSLIGITTVTPPNGLRLMYKYDDNNQLKQVVDVNGNIVEDYKYNIKP